VIRWTRSLLGALPEDMRRGVIAALRTAPFAFALGAFLALRAQKIYRSTAAFVAESQDTRSLPSGLGAIAGQFGISGVGANQAPAYFADLLTTRSILGPILDIPMTTTDDSVPRPLIDRLRIKVTEPQARQERGLLKLRAALRITPDIKTNVVSLSVYAPDPLLAYQIAQALLSSLDRFNVSVRRSRARNERDFLEGRVAAAQDDLQSAELGLEHFLATNRGDVRSSPSLAFREAGLRRKLDMTQTRFADLQRQLDQARVQEVRDTPAITVLDRPNIPVQRDRPHRKVLTLEVMCVGMFFAYGISRLNSLIRANQRPSTG
jgi:uncharacterized protein involved in exopolysaccharide biosynthesis